MPSRGGRHSVPSGPFRLRGRCSSDLDGRLRHAQCAMRQATWRARFACRGARKSLVQMGSLSRIRPSAAAGGLDDSAVANSARRDLHDSCKCRLAPRPTLFVPCRPSSLHSRKRIPAVVTRSRARNLAHGLIRNTPLPARGLVFSLPPTQVFIGWLRIPAPGNACPAPRLPSLLNPHLCPCAAVAFVNPSMGSRRIRTR